MSQLIRDSAPYRAQWAQTHDMHWHVEHDIFVGSKGGQ
jgi:hypothetical protein